MFKLNAAYDSSLATTTHRAQSMHLHLTIRNSHAKNLNPCT